MQRCEQLLILVLATAATACASGEPMDSDSESAGIGDTAAEDSSDSGADDNEPNDDDSADDDTTTGDPTAGEESEGAGECDQAMFSFEVQPETPNVMLVLDKSRSMSNLWDHDLDPATPEISRWHSLVNVVDFLTQQFGSEVNFGSQLFPSADAYLDEPVNQFSCLVNESPEVPVGPGTGAAIMAAMPAADDFTISGGTPATAGVTAAVKHLNAEVPKEPNAIVLVTDGAANCSNNEAPEDTLFVYDAELQGVVDDAFSIHSIPVYVVGINILDEDGTKPAVNAHEALTDVANRGGVPADGEEPFYNAFNEQELSEALDTVVGAIECTITLDEEPDFPELVEVTIAGTTFAEVADCEAEDGFVYTAPAGPHNAIRLCGGACNDLHGGGTVNVDYLCP